MNHVPFHASVQTVLLQKPASHCSGLEAALRAEVRVAALYVFK